MPTGIGWALSRPRSRRSVNSFGDLDRAREQLERGQAAVGSLGDDGYGQMIKGGLDRLGEQSASA
jgi:hypothetical protein